MEEVNKNYPLIIVFYLDAEMMRVREIIEPFANSVNDMLAAKKANALAFFMPTKGEERVECINPLIMKEADMEKVNQIIEDLKKSFDIAAKMDSISDSEITPDKPCDCTDGKCNCNK